MKFPYTVCILAVLQIGLITEHICSGTQLPNFSTFRGVQIKQMCEKTISLRASRRVPYFETYKEKTWGIFYKTRVRWNYRIEYHTSWRKQPICCEGYREIGNQLCESICQPPCGNGTCIRPNVCICNYGYSQETDIVFDSVCVPDCSHTCVHGKCTAPEVCTCDHGYSLTADGFTCEPVCTFQCESGSYCSQPEYCACLPGYADINDFYHARIPNRCNPVCDSECVHGTCVAPNNCTCDDGYELDPDNLFVCKPKCDHGCLYGACIAPNECACDHGYSLKSPSVCEPICSETCVMGTCVAPESCRCFDGYGLLENSKYICEPLCERACQNGRCTAPTVCTCNEGFRSSGNKWTKGICKPHCEISCGPFGICSAPGVCTCFSGYHLVNETEAKKYNSQYFVDNSACKPICDTDCINGFCIAPNACSCNLGYYKARISNTNPCEPICHGRCVNGFCSAPDTCTCNDGYRPSKNTTANICEPFCETACINGHCSAPNVCTCDSNYRPTDGNHTSLCEPVCSPSCENGVCIQPDVCSCNPGYRPSIQSTYVCDPICHAACERNGICQAPDLCVCKEGYRMVRYDEENVPFGCEPICNIDCGNGTCTAPDLCTCLDGYLNGVNGRCVPVCATCDNGTCVAPEVCKCDDGFVLVESKDLGIPGSRSILADGSGNGSRCVPRCESCDNGECVASDECRCHAGFVKDKGTCVEACEDGCGIHGECVDERRVCECNYGWTGLRCDRPALCVLFVNDEGNRTKPSRIIEEQNATIAHVFMNNPACSECTDKVNNETLCFEMYVNGTKDETQIGCLMDTGCLASSNQYKDQRETIKVGEIAGGFGILLLIGTGIAMYVLLRKRRNKGINLDNARRTSMQELVESND